MRRRAYLATAAAAATAGTAGCSWEDETTYKLGFLAVGNYLDQSPRLEVHVEENGDDAVTTEVELGPGTRRDPAFERLECGWSNDAGEFTIEVTHLGDPNESETVELPGDRSSQMDLDTCVAVSFYVGSQTGGYISPMMTDCEQLLDSVPRCVDSQ